MTRHALVATRKAVIDHCKGVSKLGIPSAGGGMRNACQSVALILILGSALLADGLMDTLGPLGYLAAMVPVLAAAGLLVWLGNRPGEQENRPRYHHYQGRRHQRKR